MIIEALGRKWLWPDADIECRKVTFDWSMDLKWVYKFCKNFRTAIQAGGNMGVWPYLMAQKFKHVLTFEPDPRCFKFLQRNLVGTENVTAYPAALWEKEGACGIKDVGIANLGAQHIVPDSGEIKMMRIDDIVWDYAPVDLVYLDIEGAELGALKGAVRTIEEHKPTIVVEDKGLSEKFGSKRGDIAKFLAPMGYRHVARVHRDSVFVCD